VNNSVKLALVTISALGTAVATSAQVAALATPAQGQAKSADPMSEVVCQKQEIVGSRLATRRICMTRQQWLEQRSSDRQDTEKAQVPSAKNGPG
jgi:predicted secreted protein